VPVHLQHLDRVVLDRQGLVVVVDYNVVMLPWLLTLRSLSVLGLTKRVTWHSLHLRRLLSLLTTLRLGLLLRGSGLGHLD